MSSNFIQNIFKNGIFSFLGEKDSQSVIGIDIGSSTLKIIQLKKRNGKAILETYGALSLGPYAKSNIGKATSLNVDMMSQAIIDLSKEANTTTKNGAISIPSSSSLIFMINLPASIPEDQLASIVPIEARKYIPVPISEVALDWWIIPRQVESFENKTDEEKKQTEQKTEVLVVAIHNDTLTRYRDILLKTNLISNFFEMEIFSSIRSTFGHELLPVLLIDFGAQKTKLSVVEFGIIKTFHVINRGSQDLTTNIVSSLNISFEEAEQKKRDVGLRSDIDPNIASLNEFSIDYIISETKSVVLAYEKKYNKSVGKIVMTGGGALLKGLHQKLSSTFDIEVVYGNPFNKVESPAFLKDILEESGPEFAVALGIALRQLL